MYHNYMYIILGRETCWYCSSSMKMLKNKNIKYKFHEIDSDSCKNYDKHIPNDFNTVPKIIHKYRNKFIFIGGYDDLVLYLKKNKKTKKKKTKKKKSQRKRKTRKKNKV